MLNNSAISAIFSWYLNFSDQNFADTIGKVDNFRPIGKNEVLPLSTEFHLDF